MAFAEQDAIGLRAAHVVGTSMGGMIAQLLALHHPARVLSLTCLMSTTGDRSLPGPTARAAAALRRRRANPAENLAQYVQDSLEVQFVMAGEDAPPPDVDFLQAHAAVQGTRMFYPEGGLRQLLAVATTPDRTPALRALAVPCAVIHGDIDPLIPLAHGEATARAIPGATLHVIKGMGHNYPAFAWPLVADAIVQVTQRSPNRV